MPVILLQRVRFACFFCVYERLNCALRDGYVLIRL